MNKTSFFFKDSKSYPEDSNLQSLVIDWLRFPLAIAVVFIHSFGSKEIDLEYLHSNPLTLESIYDFLRITLSNIGTHFAVPVFFMFSGFLFFYKVKEFNLSIYKQKLSKRFKSLFIPSYLLCVCTLLPLIWLNGRKGDGVTANVIGQTLYPFYVIASSFSVISIATSLIQKGKVKVYPHLAKVSFFVFLSHVFVLGYISNIINRCLPMDNSIIMIIKYLVSPITTVVVCLVIYWILERHLPKVLSFITGSRR